MRLAIPARVVMGTWGISPFILNFWNGVAYKSTQFRCQLSLLPISQTLQHTKQTIICRNMSDILLPGKCLVTIKKISAFVCSTYIIIIFIYHLLYVKQLQSALHTLTQSSQQPSTTATIVFCILLRGN